MRYSLARIADELHVSKATVSSVLNGKSEERRIGKELQEKIVNFCHEVNYITNIHAKRMNSTRSGAIGVLLFPGEERNLPSPLSDENSANILGGIMNAARKENYRFLIDIVTPETSINKISAPFKSREIDGLIYYGFNIPDSWLEVFRKEDYKIVGIGNNPELGIASVNIDNYNASYQLTEAMLAKGYKKFRYLHGTGKSYVGAERYNGFKQALAHAGIIYEDNPNDYAFYRNEFATDWVKDQLSKNSLNEELIFCENDNMAIGVIKELVDNNINVPDDKAVVGADDIKLAQFAELTTYTSQPIEQGSRAFELLFDMINRIKIESKNITIKTEMKLRKSTT